MNSKNDILELIKDYINCSSYLCKILKDDFKINGNTILRSRRLNLIPKEGTLSEGYFFSFHGGGCYFEIGENIIDIDFGPDDRCDGFDSDRLYEFLKYSKKKYYGIKSKNDVINSINALDEENIIVNPGWYPNPHLYYLK